jgi:hypothetical protein
VKRIKSMLLLFTTAVAATALVVPAAASAAPWYNVSTGPLKAPVTFKLTGPVSWEMIGTGTTCSSTQSEVTLLPGTEGEINNFVIDPKSCTGYGALAGCTVTQATSTNPETPWSLVSHENGTITLSGFNYRLDYNEGCQGAPMGAFEVRAPQITVTPDIRNGMTKWTIKGPAEFGWPEIEEGEGLCCSISIAQTWKITGGGASGLYGF